MMHGQKNIKSGLSFTGMLKNRGFGSNYGGYNIWRWNLKKKKKYSRAPRGTYSSCTASNTVQRRDRWEEGLIHTLGFACFYCSENSSCIHTKKNDCLNAHIRYFNVRETPLSMGRLSCTRVVTRNVWSDGSRIGTELLSITCFAVK